MCAWRRIDIPPQWELGAGDWGEGFALLVLKQMHLQLALSEEREGKQSAMVEICFGARVIMVSDLCRQL